MSKKEELSAKLIDIVDNHGGENIIIKNYINGQFTESDSHLASFNPATGKVHAQVPDGTKEDVDAATAAALEAFESEWSRTTVDDRSAWLTKIADAIEANLDVFARAESHDQGKPLWLATAVDIPRAVYNFRFFAGSVLYHQERSTTQDKFNAVNYTQRFPVGVAGLITPWNLPLYLLTWKIAPALAFGNVVVAKPSEITSLTAYLLAVVMDHIGFPKGVCNFVFGTGPSVGAAMVEHKDIPLISFTGGTVTGRRISMLAAPLQKKLSLELGGKNPSIIFDDVNVEKVATETIRSSFTNQGEICLCTSRIYVHKNIFDDFIEKLVEKARAMKVGDPSEKDTKVGALVSKEHLQKVQSYVDIAKEEGATIRCGFSVDDEPQVAQHLKEGYYMRPTVITGVTPESRCVMEEIFGPVVVVVPFETEEEVLGYANSTQYGLSAVIWSADGARAQRVASKVHSGIIWINCWMVRDLRMPFGGMKGSGIGRESSVESMEFFTEVKSICYKLD